MGLKKCVCGNMVHSDAKACPKCGKKNDHFVATIVIISIITTILIFSKKLGF